MANLLTPEEKIPVTIEDEKRKLALVVDVARAVWGTA